MAVETQLHGLEKRVTIYRDEDAIPHIRASSVADAFFAQGYTHAQDRLWHMDWDRLRAQGRWAEVVGPSGVASDTLMRRALVVRSAERDFALVGTETRSMLEAYAAGVNAYMQSAEQLPLEHQLLERKPEPWQPWDGLAIYKFRHIVMGVWEAKAWRAKLVQQVGAEKLTRLTPRTRHGEQLILPPGETYEGAVDVAMDELLHAVSGLEFLRHEGSGSNNWVVDGSRTASGKPLMAGDPHRIAEIPNVYYQNHLACDQFDVIGLSFPGLPGFPHFGHNESVAWCITHAGADTQDLFVERFDPANPSRYLFQGEWREATLHDEVIQVRGGAPVPLSVVETHHGSVIGGAPASGAALVLQYTATHGKNPGWDVLLPMLSARTGEAFDATMSGWVDPVNNLLFADTAGTIGYRLRGSVPIRSRVNGWLPAPGWTGAHDWRSMIPFAELPHSLNPAAGMFVTANNRIVGEEYPHYIALNYAADHRARRIAERLEGQEALTGADMTSIHADILSRSALQFLGRLATLSPITAQAKQACALLLAWNGQMAHHLAAPLIYSQVRLELLNTVLAPILGPLGHEALETGRAGVAMVAVLRSRIMTMVAQDDRSLLPEGARWGDLILGALDAALVQLIAKYGSDMSQWRWGAAHTLHVAHPLSALFPAHAAQLNSPQIPMGGDSDTVQAASYTTATGYAVVSTAVARYLFDLSDWEACGWVVPMGVSGLPGSPHYTDQLATWQTHRLVPMRYSWTRIAQESASCHLLLPQAN